MAPTVWPRAYANIDYYINVGRQLHPDIEVCVSTNESIRRFGWSNAYVFDAGLNKAIFKRVDPRSQPTFVNPATVTVRNGFLRENGGLFCSDGTGVTGYSISVASGPWRRMYNYFTREKVSIRRFTSFGMSKAIALVQPGDHIYGHWLLDILPKAYLAAANFDNNTPILVREDVPSFAINLLNLIGIAEDRIHKIVPVNKGARDCCRELLSVDQIHIGTSARQGTFFDPRRLDIFDELAEQAVAPGGEHRKKLFFSRRTVGSKKPHLMNAEDVEWEFHRAGFAIVSPELFRLEEQIGMVLEADVIAGVDGSALHSAVWAAAGSTLICLCSPRRFNWIHAGVAEAKNLELFYVQGHLDEQDQVAVSNNHISHRDAYFLPWYINIDALRVFLREAG